MRPSLQGGNRPASRARVRSPNAPSTRSSQAAYGFQSPPGRSSQTSQPGRQPDAFRAVRSEPVAKTAEARGKASRLSVVVRKRPMNRREAASQQDVILARANTVIVKEPKLKVDLTRYVEEHNFLFDQAFDEFTTNEQLYVSAVRPVIDAVFQRAKCTCFAYGQTGSGKTFTMMGPPKQSPDAEKIPGIFLLAAQDIFAGLGSKEHSHLGVYIAFYEIYCGKLFDLLNGRQILQCRENAKQNVVIVGLQEHLVENVQELMEVLEFGLGSRTTGVTGANVDSSRSHAILQICLKDMRNKEEGRTVHGKISFIDLAGSERGADRDGAGGDDRQTRMDGAEINKSLLALKECIRALDQQLDHTPFRGSKLTQVLKDSFVGSNCRTVMIANISPCTSHCEHSLNTLRYAYRVKELRRNTGLGAQGAGGFASGPDGLDRDQSPDEDFGEEPLVPEDLDEPLGLTSFPAEPEPPYFQARSSSREPREIPQLPGARAPAAAREPPQFERLDRHRPFDFPTQREESPASASHSRRKGDDVPLRANPVDVGEVQQSVAPEVTANAVASQGDLDDLARQHDRLIGTILAEEEELISSHRTHIDNMVELIKEEMVHLNNVDRPGSDVDHYVSSLDRILRQKAEYISQIRERVDVFKGHLQQEDSLSRKFQSLAASG